jgi:hypothetical protein
MLSGVPQRSILGPLLYTLYRADIPQSPSTILSTFADDTAIFTTHADPNTASAYPKDHLRSTGQWNQKWRLKINKNHAHNIHSAVRTLPQYTSTKQLYRKLRRLNT